MVILGIRAMLPHFNQEISAEMEFGLWDVAEVVIWGSMRFCSESPTSPHLLVVKENL